MSYWAQVEAARRERERVAARVIAEHHTEYEVNTYHLVCACGHSWTALREDLTPEVEQWAAHVAEQIAREES